MAFMAVTAAVMELMKKYKEVNMTTAIPDPFEGDWTPELEEEIRAAFDGLPFELLDEDIIEAQVAEFHAILFNTPSGVDPYEEG